MQRSQRGAGALHAIRRIRSPSRAGLVDLDEAVKDRVERLDPVELPLLKPVQVAGDEFAGHDPPGTEADHPFQHHTQAQPGAAIEPPSTASRPMQATAQPKFPATTSPISRRGGRARLAIQAAAPA